MLLIAARQFVVDLQTVAGQVRVARPSSKKSHFSLALEEFLVGFTSRGRHGVNLPMNHCLVAVVTALRQQRELGELGELVC